MLCFSNFPKVSPGSTPLVSKLIVDYVIEVVPAMALDSSCFRLQQRSRCHLSITVHTNRSHGLPARALARITSLEVNDMW